MNSGIFLGPRGEILAAGERQHRPQTAKTELLQGENAVNPPRRPKPSVDSGKVMYGLKPVPFTEAALFRSLYIRCDRRGKSGRNSTAPPGGGLWSTPVFCAFGLRLERATPPAPQRTSRKTARHSAAGLPHPPGGLFALERCRTRHHRPLSGFCIRPTGSKNSERIHLARLRDLRIRSPWRY